MGKTVKEVRNVQTDRGDHVSGSRYHPPTCSHLREGRTAHRYQLHQQRDLLDAIKGSVTIAPNAAALRGDRVVLETLNPYSRGQDPGGSPFFRGCRTSSLYRGKDGKISVGCRQMAFCTMWGFHAAARHVWKVGGWKKRSTCSHCTAGSTCFDNKDSVTGSSVFLKCANLYCWWRLLHSENRKKWFCFVSSWCHWLGVITERQKVSQQRCMIYYKDVQQARWGVEFVFWQVRSMKSCMEY